MPSPAPPDRLMEFPPPPLEWGAGGGVDSAGGGVLLSWARAEAPTPSIAIATNDMISCLVLFIRHLVFCGCPRTNSPIWRLPLHRVWMRRQISGPGKMSANAPNPAVTRANCKLESAGRSVGFGE